MKNNAKSCVNVINETKRMIFINGEGRIIEIKKNFHSCDIKLKNSHYTILESFKLSDFDYDIYQFEMCVQEIIDDTLADGYKQIQ